MIQDKTKNVTFRLTPEEYELLVDRAKDLNMSFSNFIRWTLAPYLLQARALQAGSDAKVRVELGTPVAINYNIKQNKRQKDFFTKPGRPRKVSS